MKHNRATHRGHLSWQRVRKDRRCPICDHGDWCSISADGAAVVCMRTDSGAVRGTRNGGFLHRLHDDGWKPTKSRTVTVTDKTCGRHDLPILARNWRTAVNPVRLRRLSETLGLSTESLQRLGVGWAVDHAAWSFPMTDARGQVVGIRLRLDSGRKFSVEGGREGLFFPDDLLVRGQLLVAEGPTDCAALLDLGFNVVGRPSCTGGTHLLMQLVATRRPAGVVIVADADEPGQRGADALASTLVAYAPSVKIVRPPDGVKDARAWKGTGATTADVQAVIDRAAVRTLRITTADERGAERHGR